LALDLAQIVAILYRGPRFYCLNRFITDCRLPNADRYELLLDLSGLPRFDAFRPEYVTPAVDELLAANRALIQSLVCRAKRSDMGELVAPLEDAGERLNRAWGKFSSQRS